LIGSTRRKLSSHIFLILSTNVISLRLTPNRLLFLCRKVMSFSTKRRVCSLKFSHAKVTDKAFDGFRASFAQSKVGTRFRFVTEQQAKVAIPRR
jgi:hypothetical protein